MTNATEKKYKIVWDIETTGFVAPEAKILEIGCLIVRGEDVEQKHWVLDNKVEIPQKITEITGITKEIIDKEGRDPVDCLTEFLLLFTECEQNITHNGVRFDIPFLLAYAADLFKWDEGAKTAKALLIRNTAFDTAVHCKAAKLNMSREGDEEYIDFAERVMNMRAYGVKYNLGLCCEEQGVRLDVEQHRALADVALTHRLYKKIKSL